MLKWSPAEIHEKQPGEATGVRAPAACRWRGFNMLLVHRPGRSYERTISSQTITLH